MPAADRTQVLANLRIANDCRGTGAGDVPAWWEICPAYCLRASLHPATCPHHEDTRTLSVRLEATCLIRGYAARRKTPRTCSPPRANSSRGRIPLGPPAQTSSNTTQRSRRVEDPPRFLVVEANRALEFRRPDRRVDLRRVDPLVAEQRSDLLEVTVLAVHLHRDPVPQIVRLQRGDAVQATVEFRSGRMALVRDAIKLGPFKKFPLMSPARTGAL